MNQIVNDTGYGLSKTTAIDGLLVERETALKSIMELHEKLKTCSSAVVHFETASEYRLWRDSNNGYKYWSACKISESFENPIGAVRALDNKMWWKLFNMSGLETILPAKVRNEWKEQMANYNTPEFTLENIVAAFGDIFMNRDKHFAQKVDGIFQRLSKTHVTNNPAGFRSRMIYDGALYSYYSWGSPSVSGYFAEYMQDFLEVVAVICGFPIPKQRTASELLLKCYREGTGEWYPCMGNSFRIRVYKKGTVHLEVHPELAGKLNGILATLYPLAIANQLKAPPKKKDKTWTPIIKPISPQVLAAMETGLKIKKENGAWVVMLEDYFDKHVVSEIRHILEQIGAVNMVFDYYPESVINEIKERGYIPDQKSFQFYPTPSAVALAAAQHLNAGPNDKILEPSAGTGDLLQHLEMFKKNITAVEVSESRCDVLRAKNYHTIYDNFMNLNSDVYQYDRIIMNPPFSEGRWSSHVDHAASMLKPSGRLVAILPTSAIGSFNELGDQFEVTYADRFENAFKYTSISVVIVIIDRKL